MPERAVTATTDAASPTRTLACFAATLEFAELPKPVRGHLKRLALDAFGCMLKGARLPWTVRVRDRMAAQGGRPEATLLGGDTRVPAPAAALVNATAGHGFEMDDIHRDAVIHGGSLVFPAALALAESRGGVSGAEFLSAAAAGYEVGCRVGAAAGQGLLLAGFHPQGTSGAFAAAAAAARVLCLAPAEAQQALGIAGSLGAGLMAAQQGAMVKRLHAGHAARAGVEAALLAASGFTGIEDVIEAEFGGFLSAHSPSPRPERLLDGLGERYEILNVGIKPFATVTSIHTCLEGLRAVMAEHTLAPEDVARVRAGVSRATHVHCAWPYRAQSLTAAQMNLGYGLALMALFGGAGGAEFTEERVNDPAILKFVDQIEAYVDEEIDAAGPAMRHAARISVETRRGAHHERFVEHRLGGPEKPMPEADVRKKFRDNAAAILPAAAVKKLESLLDRLEELEDVTEIASHCAAPGSG